MLRSKILMKKCMITLTRLLLLLFLLLKTKHQISEIENKITTDHNKYITTQEFNKLTSQNVTARLKQGSLVSKNYVRSFLKETDFDNKLKHFA